MESEGSGRGQSRTWVVLTVLGVLLTLNMLFLLFVGGSTDQLEAETGLTAAELESDYAVLVERQAAQEQVLAVGFLGFSLFATAIAFGPYRAGDRWAWNALWILPGTLLLTAAVMMINGSMSIGGFYAVLGLITTATLLVGRSAFTASSA